jgi:PAS domain S-box-containing protein
VLSDFVPGAALINRDFQVLSVLGPLASYLEFPPGELTKDMLAIARQGLRTKIRTAVHKAVRDKEVVTNVEARVKRDGAYFPCKITVKPLAEPKEAEDLLLVTFEERVEATERAPVASEAEEESSIVKQLGCELRVSREDLQSTIEEMESSNEELKASNEEVMSMNEELQSANEELETSKEELQSLNEELSTVNNQLRDKVDELDKANNDMTNLLASTDIATIFLDPEKRIRQFTRSTAKLLSLIAADIGRPVDDFSSRLANSALLPDVDRVLEKLTPLEKEVHTENGECYLRRVTPYRTQDNRIEGVVVTFVDITRRTRVERELKTLNEMLEQQVAERTAALSQREQEFHALADSVPARFCYLDADEVYRYVNRRCEVDFGRPGADIVGKTMEDILGPQLYASVHPHIQKVLSGHEAQFRVEAETAKGPQVFQVTYMPDFDEDGQVKGFFALVSDITARRQAEERVRLLSQVVEQSPVSVMITDPDAHIQYVNAAFERVSGYKAKEVAGRNPRLLRSGNTPASTYREMWNAITAGKTWQGEFHNRRKDGTLYWEHAYLSPVVDEAGKIRHYVAVKEDITQRKEIARALFDRERRLSAIVENAAEAIISVDGEGIIQDFNPSAEHIFGYSADEAQGQRLNLLTPALDGETYDDDFRQFVHTGDQRITGKTHEVSGRRKDGSLFYMELVFTKVDHLGLFVGLLRDISERKALEQEIIEISTFEQERIGRDIHDGIGQQLTGLTMLASSLASKLEKARRPLEAEAATQLVEHLQRATEEAKSLSQGFSPVEIAPDGLVEALSILADRTATTSGIRCRLTASRPASAPNQFDAIHLYRIAQEATNNAVKHAKAGNIEIKLEDRDQDLVLSVHDDGVGIKPMKDRRGRLGLHIMHYRCDIIGGKLKIEPLPAGGTLVRCALPKEKPTA